MLKGFPMQRQEQQEEVQWPADGDSSTLDPTRVPPGASATPLGPLICFGAMIAIILVFTCLAWYVGPRVFTVDLCPNLDRYCRSIRPTAKKNRSSFPTK